MCGDGEEGEVDGRFRAVEGERGGRGRLLERMWQVDVPQERQVGQDRIGAFQVAVRGRSRPRCRRQRRQMERRLRSDRDACAPKFRVSALRQSKP